jgi:hypothetical protein
MNLREGTRRLALLLGAVGAILGGFVSYLELQSILNQKERHARFELLANSDVLKQERSFIQRTTPPIIAPEADAGSSEFDPTQAFIALPENKKSAVLLQLSTETQTRLLDQVRSLRLAGVKAIHWTQNLGVASIETDDGKTLYPTPAPNRWLYLLAAICPLLGFALPWGLIRAVGWVGAGFFASAK